MACIRGKSICETCGKEFEWRKHDSQPPARFCNIICRKTERSRKTKERNESQFKYENATENEIKEKFKRNYEKEVVRKEGCWGWKGYHDKDGYAQITGYNGKKAIPIKAHRISYEIYNGKIPEGFRVCHTCDNPICTNPDHLWLGTAKENSQDGVKKGRISRGEDRPLAKLKENDVLEIRKLLLLGVTKANLSRKYGVSFMAISLIGQGKTWKHVTG